MNSLSQCQDDAGPPYLDDEENFGPGVKYHDGQAAYPVLVGPEKNQCPQPLAAACQSRGAKTAYLEGPLQCSGGWYCRILPDPNWPGVGLPGDFNAHHCNNTEAEAGTDDNLHCHGGSDDSTYYWWVRDHFHRQYNGRLRCCCGWDKISTGFLTNRCDYRRLVTPDENVENCRDANEDHGLGFEGGCNGSAQDGVPIPEDESQCWEVQRFGYTEDGGPPQPPQPPVASPPTMAPNSPQTDAPTDLPEFPTQAPNPSPTQAPVIAPSPPTPAPPTAPQPTSGPPPPCSDTSTVLSITFDDYPTETTWTLTGPGGVSASGKGDGQSPGSISEDTFCLVDGDYTFTISDAYGDGICCAYGQGSYSIETADGSVSISGGEFSQSETQTFTIESTVSPTPAPPTPAPPTAAPTPSVTPETTFAPTTPGSDISYLSCGNPGGSRCGGQSSTLAPHSESYPFRCCANSRIGNGWIKRDNCDVWAESLQPCEDATHDQATQRCEDAGARLCTKDEYEARCTRGTGCNYDGKLNWSSTAPDFTQFTRVTFDDFEPPDRWGNFIDGGSSAWLYTRPTANGGNDDWRNGTGSARLRNKKGGDSSIFSKDLLSSVSSFGEIQVKFWAYVFSFEGSEDFFLEYTLDGTNWVSAAQYVNNENVANNEPKNFEVVLSDQSGAPLDLSGASEFRIRFRCDASGNGDVVYIDDIEISGRAI